MARRKQSRGDCAYCGKEYTRSGMAKHLQRCSPRQENIAQHDRKRGATQAFYHLQVRDAWHGYFWLHLEMRGDAPLEELDDRANPPRPIPSR